MKKQAVTYETLRRVTDYISSSKELEDVAPMIVQSLVEVLGLKGCALMIWDRKNDQLHVAASHGLSQTYLDKGPLSALNSIAASLSEGPVAIFDVENDPRLQYPDAAKAEGIKSILSTPMVLRGKPIGVLRFYTDTPWRFDSEDIIFAQALAQISALVIDNIRLYHGLKASIDALKMMRSTAKSVRSM